MYINKNGVWWPCNPPTEEVKASAEKLAVRKHDNYLDRKNVKKYGVLYKTDLTRKVRTL